MAPFPEAEIMTIKRLQVAIRRNDFKLLKDGAYKLHEKFHSGHKFVSLDLLKEILLEVSTNPSIPTDVKDILAMTIEDILENNTTPEKVPLYREEIEEVPPVEQKVSSLTSLSYNTVKEEAPEIQYAKPVFEEIKREEAFKPMITEEPKPEEKELLIEDVMEETKISAFDAFSSAQPQANQFEIPKKYFTNSPFSAEPFKEFNAPQSQPTVNEPIIPQQPKYEPEVEIEQVSPIQKEIYYPEDIPVEEVLEEVFEQPVSKIEEIKEPEPEYSFAEVFEQPVEEVVDEAEDIEIPKVAMQEEAAQEAEEIEVAEEIKEEVVAEEPIEEEKEEKSVSIFYSQDNSNEKIKNILKFRELIKNPSSSISELLKLIGEISTQANVNTMELQTLLEQLSARKKATNLITNCQSGMLTHILKTLEVSFDINEIKEETKINLLPLFGLTNLFVCENCEEIYLTKNNSARPLVLECPKCKNAMYPDFYPAVEKSELNLDLYNDALINLANSSVWLLIHPSYNDKISSNLIETALRISSNVEEIYILDKDYNIRETYKNIISQIKPSVKVNIQNNILENFFNSI